MPLTGGDRLGPYEIIAPIGAGGMGEVYRARDTKLKREVALKVLPEAFAQDPDRMLRFQREAEVLAALNHPNIAHIYGVEERALVMELVEGETLQGPLKLETALNYARQIADALEAAHEKNIIHRDLKPANIMITPAGVVKVLDFGLAAVAQSSDPSNPVNSPTLTISPTRVGMILGTAAYMSPEQARGKPVDKRADIWAFGVVLFEMLTGNRLFEGGTVSDTLAQVLTKEPDWEQVPAKVRRLLKKCLEKDPKRRLRDMGDAWELLEEAAPLPHGRGSVGSRLGWIVAAVMTIALLGALIILRPRPVDHPLIRLNVDLGSDSIAGDPVISPDGTRVVFSARGPNGKPQLATRLLDQAKPTLLPGTENASDPFFSPDGQWVGFFADGKIKKLSAQGGAAVTLADAPVLKWGASWGEDGNIIVGGIPGTGLSRVAAAGGAPQPIAVTGLDALGLRWPQILPGGAAVLFTAVNGGTLESQNESIVVLSLKTGQIKTLLRGGYFGRYVPTYGSTGHLMYVNDGAVFALPFDPVRLESKGAASPVLDDLATGQFDFSSIGTLVYRGGKAQEQTYPIVWLDSSGKTEPLVATPGNYGDPGFSPDGQRLAVVNGSGNYDIFVYDLKRETMSRLTFNAQDVKHPVWTPDGKHIAFSARGGIFWIRADGGGEMQRLIESKGQLFSDSFSPDGRRLAYSELNPKTGADLWTIPLDVSDPDHPKPGKPEPFLQTPGQEFMAKFSPDGHWIAYYSDESGRNEVYVRPFPGSGGKWQISSGGGNLPVWSSAARQLFYQTLDAHIMVTDYTTTGDSFIAEKPRLWTDRPIRNLGIINRDLAPDGKRFAVFPASDAKDEEKGTVHVTFLLNFFDELRRRAPAGK
jgi:serine/threonine protein kinase/roadblock/LC7 domain-containing protein